MEINDDPLDGYRLNVTQSPILVTMCRIGKFIGIKGSDAGTGKNNWDLETCRKS